MRNSYAVDAVLRDYPGISRNLVIANLGYSTYVSLTHRYLYYAVPKAACTSIKSLVRRLEGCPPAPCFDPLSDEPRRDMQVHVRENTLVPSLMDLSNAQQEEVLNSDEFLRFTVVRNPYSRLISAWRGKVLLCEPGFELIYEEIRGEPPGLRTKKPVEFEEFVDYLERHDDIEWCDGHWRLQAAQLFWPAINFNFIGKIENLAEVRLRISNHIGPKKPVELERTNQSVGGEGVRLTAGLADRIHALYKRDFEVFGYERGDWNAAPVGVPVTQEAFYDEIIERNLTIDYLHREIVRARQTSNIQGNLPAERRSYWESWFARGDDPWDYGNSYEAVKYRQTFELLPGGEIATALELGCAEGHFTAQLAGRVARLIAADISATALRRAIARCAGPENIEFRQIDFISDPLPQGLDLLVCSESLYYVERDRLPAIAGKFAAVIRPGGHLLMTHAVVIADRRDRTGFDWGAPFGVETIGASFGAVDGLALIRELRTPLYRVQLFRRTGEGTARPGVPEIIEAAHGALPVSVARLAIWDGAECTRAEAQRETASDVPILMYHSIAEDGPPELAPYRVAPSRFEEQLRFLRRHGYHSISLDEWADCIARAEPPRGRPVIITFDDGYKDFVTTAAPLLEANDFRATIFVVTDKVGGSADWDRHSAPPLPLMGWDDLRALEARGFRIGSHTTGHFDLVTLSDDEIVHDSESARSALSRHLGHEVDGIAFPWGRNDGRVRAALARSGYRVGVDVYPRRSALSDDIGCLPRIEIFGDDDLPNFARKVRPETPTAGASINVSPLPATPLGEYDREEPSLMPAYARDLARRIGRLTHALHDLQAQLDEAMAPPQTLRQRLDELFNLPLTTDAPLSVRPQQQICASWWMSFEPSAAVSVAAQPKRSHAVSPDNYRNSVEIAFSGVSRWLSLETGFSWLELAAAERYQLNLAAEPNRALMMHVGLRIFPRQGGFTDHGLTSLPLDPQTQTAVRAGVLRLPDLAGINTDQPPLLVLLFADPEQGLRIRFDYLNLYFA